MSAIDFNAIATALALRFDPLNLTAPAGETAIVVSTASPPNAIPETPYVVTTLALDDDATFESGNQTRTGVTPFTVEFYLEKSADLPTQMVRLQKWAGVLLDAWLPKVQLGIPSVVVYAKVVAFRLGDLNYAGQNFAGIRLSVSVRTSDPISPVA